MSIEDSLPLLHLPHEGQSMQDWFVSLAQLLLEKTSLDIAGEPHSIREVELYFSGGSHNDPFAHRDPLQKSWSRWYFHRRGGSYRGGSFKGLDITFGHEDTFGGILIRSIQPAEGSLINGCSLCVDSMLSRTGYATVADLDSAIDGRAVWAQEAPISLKTRPHPPKCRFISTARVGLTLKVMETGDEKPRYLMGRYRFVSDLSIKKGKIHTVIALHQTGKSIEEIATLTTTRIGVVEGLLESYAEGLDQGDFDQYRGRSLSTKDLCKLHGIWHRKYDLSPSGGEKEGLLSTTNSHENDGDHQEAHRPAPPAPARITRSTSTPRSP